MQFVRLSKISYRYEGQYNRLFSDVSFDIAYGEVIALIGNNGEGKSTLLKIIMGELSGYSGQLFYPKKIPVIGYLPQDTCLLKGFATREELLSTEKENYRLIKEIEKYSEKDNLTASEGLNLAELWEDYNRRKVDDYMKRVDSIMNEMGLEKYSQESSLNLSEGEKTRLQLGKLLIFEPDILILDEPTNHLDIENMEWLESWLTSFKGALLYVSHDRVFIDRTATKIVELKRGKAVVRSGNYETYTKNREDEYKHSVTQYQERQKLLQKLHQAAQSRRRWASSFQPDTQAEGGGKKFESIFNEVRTMHRQAKHIEQRIEMLEKRHAVEKPWKEKKRDIAFSKSGSSSKLLVTCSRLTKRYNSSIVFRELYFFAERGDKIWLSGKNGSGKTTLMRIIAGKDGDYEGEVVTGERVKCGWFDQTLGNLPPEITPLQYTNPEKKDESEIRSYFGCLGLSGEIVNRQIATMSWGEKTKTELVRLLTGEYNLLLLDEPTNHLDITTRKMLEEALINYEGTVVFVSHDRAFISHLATREFSMDDR